MEEWRKIEGYDNYSISNLGRVRNNNNNKLLKSHKLPDSYYNIGLTKDKVRKGFQLHRLIAIAFIPNPNNLPIINHKNLKRDDNRIENLEWCSIAYNNQSKNTSKNIGSVCSYMKKGNQYYIAQLRSYKKWYTFHDKDKQLCEKWLEDRRYEIENGLEITECKEIYKSKPLSQGGINKINRKNGNFSWRAQITWYGKIYTKNSLDREICEKWLERRKYEIQNGLEITNN
jgi:hypothetical protein